MSKSAEQSGGQVWQLTLPVESAPPPPCPFCDGPMTSNVALYCFSCWASIPQFLRWQYAVADPEHRPQVAATVREFLQRQEAGQVRASDGSNRDL